MRYLVAIVLLLLVGCASTIKDVVKEDQKVMVQVNVAKEAFWVDKDCKAGIAQAILDVGTVSRETQFTYAKLLLIGNRESEDFKKCYGTAVYYYALYYTGRDVAVQAGNNIMNLLSPLTGVIP